MKLVDLGSVPGPAEPATGSVVPGVQPDAKGRASWNQNNDPHPRDKEPPVESTRRVHDGREYGEANHERGEGVWYVAGVSDLNDLLASHNHGCKWDASSRYST